MSVETKQPRPPTAIEQALTADRFAAASRRKVFHVEVQGPDRVWARRPGEYDFDFAAAEAARAVSRLMCFAGMRVRGGGRTFFDGWVVEP